MSLLRHIFRRPPVWCGRPRPGEASSEACPPAGSRRRTNPLPAAENRRRTPHPLSIATSLRTLRAMTLAFSAVRNIAPTSVSLLRYRMVPPVRGTHFQIRCLRWLCDELRVLRVLCASTLRALDDPRSTSRRPGNRTPPADAICADRVETPRRCGNLTRNISPSF